MSSLSEKGFKPVRGALTEGRYLALEAGGYALEKQATALEAGKAAVDHDQRSQVYVIHQLTPNSPQFQVSSAVDSSYLTSNLTFTSQTDQAGTFTIVYLGSGLGYSMRASANKYRSITRGSLHSTSVTLSFGIDVFSSTEIA